MRGQRFPWKQAEGGTDVVAALRALDADNLRAFIGEVLDRLDPEGRGSLEDALLRRAAAPSPELVDEAVELAKAARRAGYAEPMAVDEYLRRGVSASLAEAHATAQRVFEALLRWPCTSRHLRKKRRRHYEHAARIVARCVEADRQRSAAWFEALRARTSRFPAYQEALRTALGGGGTGSEPGSFADGE